MANPYLWSTTASENASADPDINWAEFQTAGSVNNSARAMMVALKLLVEAQGGKVSSGGSSNAYTLTSGLSLASLVDGVRLHFVANHSNSGASTINVDSLGAKKLRKVDGGGEVALTSGDIISAGHYIIEYDASADSAAGAFILLNPVPITPADIGETLADATGKTTPVDGDSVPLTDSAASNTLKKVTWVNIKATLKSYFDTLYYSVGGTDVSLADGGTGASLADPGADRIMFWDDSAGATAYLTASTGLEISGTSITVRSASEAQTGIVELATTAEAETGTDTARAVTPAGVAAYVAANGGGTPTLLETISTASGTSKVFDSIPGTYKSLMFVFDSVGTSLSTSNIRIAASINNGSAYGTAVTIYDATGTGDSVNGTVEVVLYAVEAASKSVRSVLTNGTVSSGSQTSGSKVEGGSGVIDAIQFDVDAGAFDGGSISLYGMP